MTISIGVQLGGPEQQGTHLDRALMVAMRAAVAARKADYDDGTTGWLNVVFLVSGTLNVLDFSGMKVGRLSSKKKGILIHVAVPATVADGVGVATYISQSLREAIDLGAKRLATKGITLSMEESSRVLDAIDAAVASAERARLH